MSDFVTGPEDVEDDPMIEEEEISIEDLKEEYGFEDDELEDVDLGTGDEEEETTETPVEGTTEEPTQQGRVFTQEEVNQIVGQARIKGRELEDYAVQLQQLTNGMDLKDVVAYMRDKAAENLVDETGMDPDRARHFVELEQKVNYLEPQLLQLFNNQQAQQMMLQYGNEKQQFLHNPLVKLYEKEIDAVSQGGQQLGWTAAMNYVLGQKVVNGEITQNLKDSLSRNMNTGVKGRSRIAPEGGASAGSSGTTVDPYLAAMAKNFGLTREEMLEAADDFEKTQRRKGGRSTP